MKDLVTKEEIKQLYIRKIRPRLQTLDEQRRAVLRNMAIVTVVVIALSFVAYRIFPVFQLILGGAAGIWYACYAYVIKNYVSAFKKDVIREVFCTLIPSCSYLPEEKVSVHHFHESKLLNSDFDEYTGEDYVQGKIGSLRVQFSEMKAKKVTRDSKGRKTESVLYEGLFFVFDLNKSLDQNTLIVADGAERILGRNIGRFLQKNSTRQGYELVQLESLEFEKRYAVYSNDQVRSRVLLSPSVMENLTDFQKYYKEPLDISIRGDKLYLAIQSAKNRFEPQIFGEVIKFKDIREIYDLIKLVRDLQDQLELEKAA